MKNLRIFLYSLIFFFISNNVYTQNSNETSFIKLLAQPNEQADTILLRWIVSDYKTWKDGMSYGFSLHRYTTHINGIPNPADSIRYSKTLLEVRLLPLGVTEWDSQFPNNDFAKVAKSTLYETDTSTVLSDGTTATLADVVNAEESGDARFVFALFAAEQDFQVAKGMALGYCDATIQAGETYIYRLAINGTDIATAISIGADDAVNLPALDTLLVAGADQTISLEWNIANTEEYYSSYTVERSTDGVTFAPLSNLPFIFASDSEEDPTTAVYKDSIDSNNMTYYYRVRGRTPFGTKGPPSPVVQAQGVPARLSNLFLAVDSQIVSQTTATLLWDLNDSLAFRLQGFNMYRSQSSTTNFEKVNTNLLVATDRTFTDNSPMPVGYYILEAIDDNNYGYESPAVLVQLPDTLPPAIPTGLTGEFLNAERIQLTWQANTESDLQGYRLFVANDLAANYIQITPQPVANEQFIYEIDPEFIVDSIYFKILATDLRENYSEKSAPFALKRPDIVPPSKPVLQKVNPTPEGIALGWRFSSSEDVDYHILERKPVGAPGWATVLNISKTDESQFAEDLNPESIAATCFIDSTQLERRGYEYRFKAYDLAGNMSSSAVISVRPYDNGQRGVIEGFRAKAECLPVGEIDQAEGYNTLDFILKKYQEVGTIELDSLNKLMGLNIISTEEYNLLMAQDPYEVKVFLDKRKIEVWEGSIIAQVNLDWKYEEQEQLKDFQIYRSAEGSPIMLYKTLPLAAMTGYVFLDEDVQPDRRYYYQIIARHTDGGFSEKSQTLMVKVPKF